MPVMLRLDTLPEFGDFRVLSEFTHRVSLGRSELIEEHFKILLRPAPRWCPERLWLRMAARFITLGEIRP